MSEVKVNGPELYELIQQLERLRDEEHAFRVGYELRIREERERMQREQAELDRLRREYVETHAKIRERLGVPIPVKTATAFDELFKDSAFKDPTK